MVSDVHQALRDFISRQYNDHITGMESIAGGSINHAYRLQTKKSGSFFCKTNEWNAFPYLFLKEQNGLAALARSGTLKVPVCIHTDRTEKEQWLLLEWVDEGRSTLDFWKTFGKQLAELHHHHAKEYGFSEDNYMGSLHQSNTFHTDWSNFFIHERLMPQVTLASGKGLLSASAIKTFEKLYTKLPSIFSDEMPALLHGDLWNGNFICSRDSIPVLIDPAVYYGNRQVDLAMTTLFGGFDKGFYESYQYHFPLPDNYLEQWRIINLYPLLVHLNLFGKSYLSAIIGTIDAY